MAAFYQDLSRWGEAVAVSYATSSGTFTHITYQQLQAACDQFIEQLNASGRSLIGIVCHNNLPTLVAYIACLQAKHPALLIDASYSESQLDSLQAHFAFHYLVDSGTVTPIHQQRYVFDKRLALLLSTSGSTGSPKHVALSYQNIEANTQSICAYLPIQQEDVTLTTLPFNYSYGLSVINTHLAKGAHVVMNQHSVVSKAFWQILETQKVSSIAGVPYTYEMLLRLGLTRKELPFLKYFTQAGGKLDEKRVRMLSEYAQNNSKSFFVMYGQTEASARMAYMEPKKLPYKPQSIGKAIPNGQFSLNTEQGEIITHPNTVGELVYQGPNVMLGYAQNTSELAYFDELSKLRTGDLAYFDDEGDYFIAGRLKRFVKIFGKRIALDEVEQLLSTKGVETYAVGDDNTLRIGVLLEKDADENERLSNVLKWLTSELSIHHSTIKVMALDHLPRTANGKPDYEALKHDLLKS
ncbi:AMP-binding protein [Alteromonas sp. a30]|uniref:AMP-binding protein n=1 Tax=Alteromonas sp. a30 TaxID=2730917 RepID=UPI0022802028|nr:AMP-binding protein [Alteromonas sp. a30]MCY7294522.1 AMP-binding protein [Alteromonas sp. a30]